MLLQPLQELKSENVSLDSHGAFNAFRIIGHNGYPSTDIIVDKRTHDILTQATASLKFTRRVGTWGVILESWHGYTRSEAIKLTKPFPTLSEVITGTHGKKRIKKRTRWLNDFTAYAHGVDISLTPPINFTPSLVSDRTPNNQKPPHILSSFEEVTRTLNSIAEYISVGNTAATLSNVNVDCTNQIITRGRGSFIVDNKIVAVHITMRNTIIWYDNKQHIVPDDGASEMCPTERIAALIDKVLTPELFTMTFDNLTKLQLDELRGFFNNYNIHHSSNILKPTVVAK